MAPLSRVPGRIRFSIPELKNRPDAGGRCCRLLQGLEGVREVSLNPRTGRLLVCFDEGVVAGRRIEQCLVKILTEAREIRESGRPASRPDQRSDELFAPGRVLLDLAAHALLPKPLDVILPAAVGLLRGQRAPSS